jgi:hypothetical protein
MSEEIRRAAPQSFPRRTGIANTYWARPWASEVESEPIRVPTSHLILKRASASRHSGEWNEDDFDVLADGAVVGRLFKANAAPVGMPWMWTLGFGHHEDRTPTHDYAATARPR